MAVAGPWPFASAQSPVIVVQHEEPVFALAFSPDGTQLVTGSDDDDAKLWDIASGAEVFSLSGHNGRVAGVAFSPDGSRIASSKQR